MRRSTLTPITAALACLLAGPVDIAAAHELLVARPGPVELDLGTGEPVRLVHATLGAGDELVATIRVPGATADAWVVETLVPAAAAGVSPDARRVIDDATTVEYRVLGSRALADVPERAGVRTVTVVAGDAPSVALRIAPTEAPFSSEDIDRTPRSLLRLRAWVEASAPAANSDRAARTAGRDSARGTGLAGLAIALAGVLVAVWWVARGRTRSRVRGIERARDDDA